MRNSLKKKTPKLKILKKKTFISDVYSSTCQQNYVFNLHAYCLNRKGTFEIKKIFFYRNKLILNTRCFHSKRQ